MANGVAIVRSKSGRIKSVVVGGRQITVGSRAYSQLSGGEARAVSSAISSSESRRGSSGGATSPITPTAAQETTPTPYEQMARAPQYTPASTVVTPTTQFANLQRVQQPTPLQNLQSRTSELARPKTDAELVNFATRTGTIKKVVDKTGELTGRKGATVYDLGSSAYTGNRYTANVNTAAQVLKGGAVITRPAYTPTGIRQRAVNVRETLKASLGKGEVTSNIKTPVLKEVVEFAANRPFEAALTVQGAGLFVQGITKAPAAARAASAAYTAARGAGRGVTRAGFGATRAFTGGVGATGGGVGSFAKDFAAMQFVGYTSPVAAKGVGYATANKEMRGIARSVDVNKAYGAAFAAEQEKLSGQGVKTPLGTVSLKRIAYEISPLLVGDKATFRESAQAELARQGLTGQKLRSATDYVVRQRTFGATGETASLLFLSAGAEAIGRKQAAAASARVVGEFTTKEAAKKITARSIAPLSVAGFSEGYQQELAQQRARGQKSDYREALKLGGFGAGSAVALGAPIIYTTVKRSKLAKPLTLVANVADPYEYAGDKLADVGEAVQRRLGRSTPTISLSYKDVKKEPTTFVNAAPTKTRRQTPTTLFVNMPSRTQTPSRSSQPTFSIFPTTQTPTTIKKSTLPITPSPFVPSRTPTIPIGTTPITPIPIRLQEPTETPISTTTTTSTFITNIAPTTTTPQLRFIPPIIPFGLGSAFGSGAGRKGKRLKFVDELQASQAALVSLLGGGKQKVITYSAKKSKRRR